jgi:hypothetical protein
LPNLPAAAQVVFATVPVFPFPDESATVVPDPSSNPYAATKPVAAAFCAVAEAMEVVARATPSARTRS